MCFSHHDQICPLCLFVFHAYKLLNEGDLKWQLGDFLLHFFQLQPTSFPSPVADVGPTRILFDGTDMQSTGLQHQS